jgi:hypothetical protein
VEIVERPRKPVPKEVLMAWAKQWSKEGEKIVDSQSIKTTGVGGKERGYDGAKKVKGRKRHLLVDTQGLLLKAKIHSARVQDREGIKLLLEPSRDRLPQRLSHLFGWMPATPERARAQTGRRRHWDGQHR